MLYIVSMGETIISARLTEKDAIESIRSSIAYPEYEEDQLVDSDTPNEKRHLYRHPDTQTWVTSGYKITNIPNPLTHHAEALLQEAIKRVAETEVPEDGHNRPVAGYEWGVRIQDAAGIERILDTDSLEIAARNRVDQYRRTWAGARLVRRPVYDEPWEEVAD